MNPPRDETPRDHLALAAEALCAHCAVVPGRPRPIPLWAQLGEVSDWLGKALRHAADPDPEAAKAAEWLLDNQHHLRRAIRQVREDMPTGFYNRLPACSAPECERLPRVYLVASRYLDATHMQVSLATAVRFLTEFQKAMPLRIAELWAFPVMLRIACLEMVVAAFSELVSDLEPPVELSGAGRFREIHDPTETVSRAVAALIAISDVPWKEFFDQVSHVEAILREDPAGVYARMDFDTRDRYRKAVEEVADGSGRSEWEVARAALAEARARRGERRRGHVGCWLVAEGRPELERALGFRARPDQLFRRFVLARPHLFYFGGLATFTALAMILPLALLWSPAVPLWATLAGTLLSLFPASVIGITLTHWLATTTVPPRVLPKLDFEEGLSEDCESAVIMPVILGGPDEARGLLERIERHWLANADPRLRFVLLTDPADAPEERVPGDDALEAALVEGVRALNRRYAEHAPFVLLHRRRVWNEAEGVWMAWERKRGKIEQFNAFLLGELDDPFPVKEGDVEKLKRARFVVTLDLDTQAPPGSVRRLIGTLAHPLNRVEFDPAGGRPRHGYSFIQPRVEISPEAGNRSLFTRLYTGDTAIDIYSRAVSDVYQDLFGEGIFTGKGAYDVAAFHQSLEGRVPENRLLSHDLFEGLHGRVALASDIVFYEDFPPSYLAYLRRWHRWVRGDWQLLPWLGRRVPGRGGARLENPLGLLDRWKILDNLRRSLTAPALVALAILGWTALPGSAWIWTALVAFAPGAYIFTDLVTGLAHGRRRGAVRGWLRRLADHGGRWLLALVFMAAEAVVALDAIARALWRQFVSGRHLLEWTTAAHTARLVAGGRGRYWAEMAGAPLVAAFGALLVVAADPGALAGAAPLLALWFLSPEIAHLISRERRRARPELDAGERAFLRRLARRIWLFFETFAGPDDNWLAPDNFQTDPHDEVAHRTSPTNIAMQLVSAVAARDFGHIGLPELAMRAGYVLDTLERLERYRGHFLNWFDTRTLEPLEPRYVSTVDSGNLAVALVTLAESCREARRGPALSPALWDGLADTVEILAEAVAAAGRSPRGLVQDLRRMAGECRAAARQRDGWLERLGHFQTERWPALKERIAEAVGAAPGEALHEVRVWVERVSHHLAALERDTEMLAPWLAHLGEAPAGCRALAAEIAAALPPDTPLDELAGRAAAALERLDGARFPEPAAEAWAATLRAAIERGSEEQRRLDRELETLGARAAAIAYATDFRFLFDREASIFFIGYNLSANRMDPHHYDLLASEARLASYFAIAKGDVPVEHWFHLGRPIARVAGELTVLSWNGSMFEYLMPRLFLRADEGRLLGQSERVAVKVQRLYGERLGLPWGVSESAYAARDAEQHYQYQAFGVPGLGLKRGLGRDYVVAPYATVLAAMVDPRAALGNLRRLAHLGLLRLYGFLEAADFTPERRPEGSDFVPVRAWMAHHQGMSMGAIANTLLDDILVARFMREPRMAAVGLLLQERVPWEFPPEEAPADERPEEAASARARRAAPPLAPWAADEAPAPQLHLLGNGRMASWVTDSGAGALWWHDQALTRWSGDILTEAGALRYFLCEPERGAIHPLGRRPPGRPELAADVFFHAHMAEFHQRLDGLSLRTDVSVAPAEDLEIRRFSIVNESGETREFLIASCGEVVLAPWAAHERHPAFSKLFVHSELLPDGGGLLFSRRPRGPGERPPVMLHRLVAEDPRVEPAGAETDRRALLGRHGDPLAPRALLAGLAGNAGWTLDPVMVLAARVRLGPGEHVQLGFVTVAAGSRDTAVEIAARHATLAALDWAVEDAARSAAREAHRMGLGTAELADGQRVSRDLVAPPPRDLAPWADLPAQQQLWALGISGDVPIVLMRIADGDEAPLLRTAVRLHEWWRRRGLRCDLVILRTGASGYEEPLRDALLGVLREAGVQEGLGGRGGVHMHSLDRIGAAERAALEASAALVLSASAPSLSEGRPPLPALRPPPPRFEPIRAPRAVEAPRPLPPVEGLRFANGFGGFSPDGREYVIGAEGGALPPAPWCNVLANERFGTIVSEAGLGFTWGVNSGEHRITPWSNDPLLDPQGEAIWLRDEESGETWSPTPLPAGAGAWRVHHRPGLTTWLGAAHGIEHRLRVFVPPDAPVKLAVLRLSNPGPAPRRLTATFFAEWVMGAIPGLARRHVVCGYEAEGHALVARSGWNPEFADRVAFVAASHPPTGLTCERATFIGREGSLRRPEGLMRTHLDGNVERVGDPCAALQVMVELAPGAREDVVFVLGEAAGREEMVKLARRWADPQRARRALDETLEWWEARIGAVEVETPDPAFDLLVNRWLPYQALASRILARAGFHQAGGAFGFRDQLQDVMAFMLAEPQRARAHILACAARQFEEGDVLHWWHPPAGRGVRTRCSDDLLWLPYVTARYVEATGDTSILDEKVPFLSAPPLADDEEDRYALFTPGGETGTLFEHCRRAMEKGVTAGAHGLPLIGSGDWNDGMDRVGRLGRGESVWLAWFAAACADGFAGLARRVGRRDLARLWAARAGELRRAAEEAGWDGAWFLRAFDDDGLPWGSKACEECKIDSIAQSWSVLNGVPSPRAATALASAREWLVDEEQRLVKLLTPPFDRTPRDPGYIRAYPPGVRENGGQYTHAAAWLGLAHAVLGDGARAHLIFDLINPIRRTETREGAERYRAEPYVLPGDVRAAAPGEGQAGWTWYTGAAAWSWRLAVEGILGLRLEEGAVRLDPALPPGWRGAAITLRTEGGILAIRIEDPEGLGRGAVSYRVDGRRRRGERVALPSDGRRHEVVVRLGRIGSEAPAEEG